MHIPLLLITLPFTLIMLVAAVPIADTANHYTEADIMQLRLTGKDEREILTHLGLKASSPSYQLAPNHVNANSRSPSEDSDTFRLVPHQEFEKEKRRQLHHRGQHGLRRFMDRLVLSDDENPPSLLDDPLDVRSKGLKPQYLRG